MTDNRFWKIADKYERFYDTHMGMEVFIDEVDNFLTELVYYCKGHFGTVRNEIALYNEALTKKLPEGWSTTASSLCDYYDMVGKEIYRKTYKKVFTNN